MNIIYATEYLPDYQGVCKVYVTYNLDEKTYTIEGKTKPLNEYRYKKALEHLNEVNKNGI